MDAPADPVHARRNWWAHAVEGGLFMGAMAIVNAQTLLPTVVKELRGPELLVALTPALMMVGFQLPPVFTAHRVAGLGRFHPLLLWTGVPQRLPYLLAALTLLLAPERPAACLAAVALAPLVSGVFGGISATAWQQLVARTVPARRRSSLFAVRFAISAGLGIAAGGLVKATLAAHPGPSGYGLLHLWAFLGLGASYAVFALIREPAQPQAAEPPTGLWENVRSLPALVAADARLRRWLAASALFTLGTVALPYLAIHARRVAGEPASFLGTLIGWQSAGTVLGGLAAGWAGDRWGGRAVMLVARSAWLALGVVAPSTGSAAAWCALFALLGAATTANNVGGAALQLEILPERGRANRLAVMAAAQLPVAIAAGVAGSALWARLDHRAFPWLAAAGAALTLASMAPLAGLRDPRHERAAAA